MIDTPELNAVQANAVNTFDRNVLVMAGPGAGKSLVLTAHAAKLASRHDGRVILLTFANRAADALRIRTKALLPPAAAHAQIVAKTVHAYALELVTVHADRLGVASPSIQVIGNEEVRALAQRIVTDAQLPVPEVEDYGRWLESLRRKNIAMDELSGEQRSLLELVEAEMCRTAAIDFGTVIHFARRLLEEFPEVAASVRRHDKYLIIDEAQDLDAGQIAFLNSLIGPDTHVAVAIDPNQSLYRWRDADPDRVLRWTEHLNAVTVALTENYRCAPRIARIGDHILGSRALSQDDDVLPGAVELWRFSSEEHEASMLAAWVRDNLHTVDLATTAILSRAAYRVEAVRSALKTAGVALREPSVAWSQDEQAVLNALAALAEWLSGRETSGGIRSIPYDVLGVSPDSAERIEAEAVAKGMHPGDLLSEGIWPALRDIAQSRRTPSQLVAAVAETMSMSMDNLGRLAAVAGTSQTLGSFLRSAARAPAELADEANAVLVSTFHGAKGLQFARVVIVGAEDGTVPDFRARTHEKLVEERRALYVATTRATDMVAFTLVRNKRGYSQALSRFLPPADSGVWTAIRNEPGAV